MNRMARRRAFTIVEMIIVIGILAVIGAVMTGVIIRARQTSRSMVCLNNLRQISGGLMMYQQEFGHVPVTTEVSLLQALSPYLCDGGVFICPAAHTPTVDSYSRYYVPRPANQLNGYLIGCANHTGEKASMGAFGMGRAMRGKTCGVTWNGKPVQAGAEVTGGMLRFADGTEVSIEDDLQVMVLTSFEEAEGRIYSAIKVPAGAIGSVEVKAAHGTHFDVTTPACTAGVRGTKFTVSTSEDKLQYRTLVAVTEGVVAVDTFRAQPQAVPAGQELAVSLDKEQNLPKLTVKGPFFFAKLAYYHVTNNSDKPLLLNAITYSWPASNKALDDVYMESRKIYGVNVYGTLVNISSNWSGSPADRTFKKGESKYLNFSFEKYVDMTPGKYKLTLDAR